MLPSQRALLSGFAPESQRLFLQMSVAPGGARKNLIDRTIKSLRAAGVWDKLDILYLLAAHDEQAARQNWKNPGTFTLTAVNAPTFTADQGTAGDGATSYLETNYNPSTQGVGFTRNDASIFVWSRTQALDAGPCFGQASTSTANFIIPRSTGDLMTSRINVNTSTTVANTDGRGLYAFSRTASTVQEGFKNGVSTGAGVTNASVAIPNVTLNLLKNVATYSTTQVAAAGAGASLTTAQHAALYSILLGYMQAVGAA